MTEDEEFDMKLDKDLARERRIKKQYTAVGMVYGSCLVTALILLIDGVIKIVDRLKDWQ